MVSSELLRDRMGSLGRTLLDFLVLGYRNTDTERADTLHNRLVRWKLPSTTLLSRFTDWSIFLVQLDADTFGLSPEHDRDMVTISWVPIFLW